MDVHIVDILSVSLAIFEQTNMIPSAASNGIHWFLSADRAPQAKTWSRGAGTLRRRRAQDRRELSLSMHRRDGGFLDAGMTTKIVGFPMGISWVTHQLE